MLVGRRIPDTTSDLIDPIVVALGYMQWCLRNLLEVSTPVVLWVLVLPRLVSLSI